MKPRHLFCTRRCLLTIVAACAITAAPSNADATAPSRLDRRLDLWVHYARSTQNLVAAIHVTRRSSLLVAPFEVSGGLVFEAPATLMMGDAACVTLFDGNTVVVRTRAIEGPSSPHESPADIWLAQALTQLFHAADTNLLRELGSLSAPRGTRAKLVLHPPRDGDVRQVFRELVFEMDVVEGQPSSIVLHETDGDVLEITLTDVRRNLHPDVVEERKRAVMQLSPDVSLVPTQRRAQPVKE